jgi:class 3 adenylate cyclase/predicted ATPase
MGMPDIRAWLEDLGLAEYADAFEVGAIGLELLPELDHDVLKDLGVLVPGHRLQILKAARQDDVSLLHSAVLPTETAGERGRTASTQHSEAERRQITVMFCDLVGSTALSEKIDPEDLRAVMQAYQQAAGGVIEHYDGHVAQYLGDGLMTYFGWPTAHEDDAERAVRAGLDIVGAVKKVDGLPKPLRVRVGIATGPVVVGETGAGDASVPKLAVGETPNLAARLQSLAGADEIVVGSSTRRLLGGTFELDDLGKQTLKGVVEPMHAHRVTALAATEGRFEAQHQHLTPLVGREAEIALVMERWQRTRNGDGQVVLLSGEPGIGKSRITQTLRERLAGEPHSLVRDQCSPYYTNSSLYPVMEQMERAAGFVRGDDAEAKLDKLEAVLRKSGDTTAVALIAALLSIDTTRYPALNMSPQKRKDETLKALADEVFTLAEERPVLLIFEDAHWIDPTTQELLDMIVPLVADYPILLVITFRPEYAPPWHGLSHLVPLTLTRLGRAEAITMVERVTGGKSLPEEVLDQIVAKIDGVPLFVEELTKTVLEADLLIDQGEDYVLDGPLPPLAIPSTLQDSLMARLDRLSPVKEIAQIGACIGREFSYQLLTAVSKKSKGQLDDALNELLASDLVHSRGRRPEMSYIFKHALVQDVAYGSLLKSRCREIHAMIGQVLEHEFPRIIETEPELIAHHYSEAGLGEHAIPYWLKAGQRATARSANSEALDHLNRGLSLVSNLPESPNRDQRELEFLVAATTPIIGTKGWGTNELAGAYKKAMALCETVENTPLVSRSLYMQWGYGTWTARHSLALEAAEQQIRIGREGNDEIALLMGHGLLGRVQCYLGNLVEGRRNIEKSLEMYDPGQHGSLALQYGQDPAMAGYGGLSWCLWILGYPEQAHEAKEKCLQAAETLDHAQTRCYALAVSAVFYGPLALAADELESMALKLNALIEEQSFFHWAGVAECVLGWVRALRGDPEGAISIMHNGLKRMDDAGMDINQPLILGLIASACLRTQRTSEGLQAVREALKRVKRTGEIFMEPELHRLHGELLLQTANTVAKREEAILPIRKAIDLSIKMGAAMWSLRAAASWVKASRESDEKREAHEALQSACKGLPEGHNSPDLADAQTLLTGFVYE